MLDFRARPNSVQSAFEIPGLEEKTVGVERWMDGSRLGYAVTALFTNALKLLVGKPRPDLLSRCVPNLTDVTSHVLGGISDQISEGTLVSWTICQQTDRGKLKDGFQSFPSGHASCRSVGHRGQLS